MKHILLDYDVQNLHCAKIHQFIKGGYHVGLVTRPSKGVFILFKIKNVILFVVKYNNKGI